MRTDQDVAESLEGAETWQIVEALYNGTRDLIANDPTYFAEGRANSIVHTLKQLITMLEDAA